MKLKTKSGTIYDSEKHAALQDFTKDDILEMLGLYEKFRDVKRK